MLVEGDAPCQKRSPARLDERAVEDEACEDRADR
jgi:hypothetical protein